MSSEFHSEPAAPVSVSNNNKYKLEYRIQKNDIGHDQDSVPGPEEDMDPPESMSVATDYNHSDVLAYLINEVYRPRIEEDVNFRGLMSFMPFMTKIMPDVYNMEKYGNKKDAARVFFAHLKEVEEEGKYQSFVEALRRAKYLSLVKILENKEVIHNDSEHKELINIYLNDIAEKIDPDLLSNELQGKGVITSDEGEQIRTTSRNSRKDASIELLLAIPRRIANWYEIFLGVLLEYNLNNLVKEIDPKFFAQKTRRSEEEPDSSLINYKDLSPLAHVNTTQSGHNNDANFTASTVATSQTSSTVNMPASNVNSAHFIAGELRKLGDQHSATTSTVPANFSSKPDQRERTAISSSENKTELLSELADLKLMFHGQTQYLKEMLQLTDQVVRRMDRLEQKLDDFIKVTSHKK